MSNWFFSLCNAIFKTSLRTFADFEVEGKENVPPTGPVLVVSNHLSIIDPALVGSVLDRAPNFLAKRELFKIGVFSFLLKTYGAFPLDRSGTHIRAVSWALTVLKNGGVLVLFPEGTRSMDLKLQHGEIGAATIAARVGSPILPIGIVGSEKFQNAVRVLVPMGKLRVRIGKPFFIKTEEGRRVPKDTLYKATDEIMARIGDLLPPERRGEFKDLPSLGYIYTSDVLPSDD